MCSLDPLEDAPSATVLRRHQVGAASHASSTPTARSSSSAVNAYGVAYVGERHPRAGLDARRARRARRRAGSECATTRIVSSGRASSVRNAARVALDDRVPALAARRPATSDDGARRTPTRGSRRAARPRTARRAGRSARAARAAARRGRASATSAVSLRALELARDAEVERLVAEQLARARAPARRPAGVSPPRPPTSPFSSAARRCTRSRRAGRGSPRFTAEEDAAVRERRAACRSTRTARSPAAFSVRTKSVTTGVVSSSSRQRSRSPRAP